MTLTAHARETMLRLAGRVDQQIALAMSNPAEDPVHDLRVAIRRLSQALRVFAGLFPDKEARSLRRTLKPALSAAATARDIDVGVDLLLHEGLPEGHALYGKMRGERERAILALIGQLYLLRAAGVPACWLPRFEALRESTEDVALLARTVLPPLAAEFFKTGRKIALKADSAQRLHAFRLTAKRFRYTLELDQSFYGPVFQKRLNQVREIQSLLGKRQDCAVMAERLRPLAQLDEALEKALAAVESRGLRLESQFRQFWHEAFDAEGEQLLWERYLARRPAGSTPLPVK